MGLWLGHLGREINTQVIADQLGESLIPIERCGSPELTTSTMRFDSMFYRKSS